MPSCVTIDGKPVYQALVDSEDTGMMRISLVDDPAVQSNFLAFKAARVPQMYAVQDEEQRRVLGVVMRADFPIYRRDDSGFEYYIIYKADTIRVMAEKYLAENRQNLVNLMHEAGSEVDGVQMVQYFIKNGDAGLAPAGFDGIADGSLFAEFHITNDEVWAAVKDGTYKGFSLEGVFDLVPEEDLEEVRDIVDSLNGIFAKIFPNYQTNMSKVKGLLARLARALVSMGNLTTDKGILSWDGDEELKAGDAVYIQDQGGNRTPAADGDYTGDGKVIVVQDGKVAEIRDASEPAAPAPANDEPAPAVPAAENTPSSVQTDKGVLSWNGELAVGTAVTITGEDGEPVAAPDGEYVAEDGRTIVVSDGKVSEIREAGEPAQAEPAAPQADTAMKRIAEAFQETYNEKADAILAAIRALGFGWGYLEEAGDEFAIFVTWNDQDQPVFYRFNILEWGEDGKPVLENGVKVVPAFVTPEDKEKAEADFKAVETARDDALRQVETLQAEVAALKAKPAAKPAHATFEGSASTGKTGNKGLDRVAELMGKE